MYVVPDASGSKCLRDNSGDSSVGVPWLLCVLMRHASLASVVPSNARWTQIMKFVHILFKPQTLPQLCILCLNKWVHKVLVHLIASCLAVVSFWKLRQAAGDHCLLVQDWIVHYHSFIVRSVVFHCLLSWKCLSGQVSPTCLAIHTRYPTVVPTFQQHTGTNDKQSTHVQVRSLERQFPIG